MKTTWWAVDYDPERATASLVVEGSRHDVSGQAVVRHWAWADGLLGVERAARVLDFRLPHSPPGQGKRKRSGPRRARRRALLRLAERRANFDALPARLKQGRKRPGSLSGRK